MPATISITLKNYRCFTDIHPATIEFGPGFTALVGPNNSGKSAYLKFIYEFQPLWGYLTQPNFLQSLHNNPTNSSGLPGLRGVADPQDILCDYTRRGMTLEFRSVGATVGTPYVRSIALSSEPGNPTAWKAHLDCAPVDCPTLSMSGNDLLAPNGQPLYWQPFRESFTAFSGCLFAPAFRNAINEGSGSYYGMTIGTTLVTQWNQWKGGTSRATKVAIQSITEDIRHIFSFRGLEINASADGKNFEAIVDGRPYRLQDLGAGISQFIILFANAATMRPPLILLDEPELNLHPSLQIDFLTSLASYASTGCVIFATHSLGLARAVADRIYTLTPSPDGTIVTPFERTPNYAEFAGEMSFSSFRELGFSTILMVEGPSEVKAIQQFLRLLGRDHEIVVLHLGGSSMISPDRQLELGELRRITPDVAVLIDSEREGPGAELGVARKRFLEDCMALGFRVHATTLRSFENYLPDRAVKKAKGESYSALQPYQRLHDVTPAWAKADNWRIAREMTKDELLSTDVGGFLASLPGPGALKRS